MIAAMATNKELLDEAFASFARGDGTAFVNLLDEAILWTVIGTTAWSGPLRGKNAVLTQLLGPLSAQLANAPTFVRKRIIADGDDVAVEFQGQNKTQAGKDYSNTYCAVLRMANGKIVELTEYMDTALVNTALDPPSLPV